MFVYWPSLAVPVATHVKLASGARTVAGQLIAPILLSRTRTDDSVTLPTFVTVYVQVIGVPTRALGPVPDGLSVPLVLVTIVTAPMTPNEFSGLLWLTGSPAPSAVTVALLQ